MYEAKAQRLFKANQVLRVISQYGRKFFKHGNDVACLEVDARGKVWYWDSHTHKRVYTHYRGNWREFTEGGTLRSIVENLRDYIRDGTPMRNHFGPWPTWYNDDVWGYGLDEMQKVRHDIALIGL